MGQADSLFGETRLCHLGTDGAEAGLPFLVSEFTEAVPSLRSPFCTLSIPAWFSHSLGTLVW